MIRTPPLGQGRAQYDKDFWIALGKKCWQSAGIELGRGWHGFGCWLRLLLETVWGSRILVESFWSQCMVGIEDAYGNSCISVDGLSGVPDI